MNVTMLSETRVMVFDDNRKEICRDPGKGTEHPKHPCFDRCSVEHIGRLHLPVAPKCNIKCSYCERRYGCVEDGGPGSAYQILNPEMAMLYAKEVVARDKRIRAIGIAGPGDPLANEETIRTLKLIHRELPGYIKCLCTNGLALSEKVVELKEAGLHNLTVTVNAVEPRIGAKIYTFVVWKKELYRGVEAAHLLWEKQQEGIAKAIACGLRVKINTVYIPGINEDGLIDIARAMSSLGVPLMNLVPLIPRGSLRHLRPPTHDEISKMRAKLQDILPQMDWCRQCRADAVGLLSDARRCHGGRHPQLLL